MNITIGTWAIPAALTVAAYMAAWFATPAPKPTGGYFPDMGPAILGMIWFGAATIFSLAAWLVWSLAR